MELGLVLKRGVVISKNLTSLSLKPQSLQPFSQAEGEADIAECQRRGSGDQE